MMTHCGSICTIRMPTPTRCVAVPQKLLLPRQSQINGEIENLRTINQMLNLDLDYAVDQKWNVAFDIPLVMLDHTHTLDAAGSFLGQQAKFTGLGDVRVLENINSTLPNTTQAAA